MPYADYLIAWWSALAIAALLALWRGGWADRAIVASVALNSVVSVLVLSDSGWSRLQWPLMAADTALLLVLLAIVAVDRRRWTILLTAIDFGLVCLHGVTVLQWPEVWIPAYAVLTILLSWGFLLAMVASVAFSVARRSRSRSTL